MSNPLIIAVGQYSDKGRKPTNQDFHGACIPTEPLLSSKGICVALADGISSSNVSQEASQTAIKSFLEDYYCTSDAWSVKTSAQRVLFAINSWLHSQTHRSQFRYDKDKGYVCTFSALIFKSTTAHIFHAGDARIYRAHDNSLEQLTNDHRIRISGEQHYLSRALGITTQLEIDYQDVAFDKDDLFILATDGVYEYVNDQTMLELIRNQQDDLDAAARKIVEEAYANGSDDNLTVQIVRIEQVPSRNATELYQQLTDQQLTELPFPPELQPRMVFDGYTIVRQLYASSRSHVYLALDNDNNTQVVIKTPSIDLRGDAVYLERFLMEEWIARRIDSPYVLKPRLQTRKRHFLYVATEFIEGKTLTQWMIDNPKPDIDTVRSIIEQVAKGLRAFHRMEMLHQDLRPENIMIDHTGTVKIIDFGSTLVAGINEMNLSTQPGMILGTAQYTAPEYFLGEAGTARSDLFSLGVITYQMLSGRLPYGTKVSTSRTKAAQRRLHYATVLDEEREIPAWVDEALRKSVHISPEKRHDALSEFIYELRHPSKTFLNKTRPPLIERNPLAFWQSVSAILALIVLLLIVKITQLT